MVGLIVLNIATAGDEKRLVEPSLHRGLTAQKWHQRYLQDHRALAKHGDMVRALRVENRKLTNQNTHLYKSLRATLSADLFGSHWLERAFMCIHAGEGAWNDPNAPYYGGLQMDESFQKTYGREYYEKLGTADKWPISVQLAVAIKAFLSGRGFHPWPTTARICKLL